MAGLPDVKFEELQTLLAKNKVILIDVREPQEIKAHGKIPNSINIPVNDVAVNLKLPPEEFQRKYKRDPPESNGENLIFTCRSGRRASAAAETAIGLGFTKVKVYKGSFNDWVERNGEVEEEK